MSDDNLLLIEDDDDAFYVIKKEEWPYVLIDIKKSDIDDGDWEMFCSEFTSVLQDAEETGQKVRISIVLNGITGADFKWKVKAVTFILSLKELAARTIIATALIAENALARGFINTLLSLVTLQSKHCVFGNEHDGEIWAKTVC